MTPQYIMHAGRILPVVALCKSDGIPSAVVKAENGLHMLVPLTQAIAARPAGRCGWSAKMG